MVKTSCWMSSRKWTYFVEVNFQKLPYVLVHLARPLFLKSGHSWNVATSSFWRDCTFCHFWSYLVRISHKFGQNIILSMPDTRHWRTRNNLKPKNWSHAAVSVENGTTDNLAAEWWRWCARNMWNSNKAERASVTAPENNWVKLFWIPAWEGVVSGHWANIWEKLERRIF